MTSILVPYHLDEYLPELDVPGTAETTVLPSLPEGTEWARLAWLYGAVAVTVAGAVSAGHRPLVLSGDCTTSLGVLAGLQRAGVDPAVVWCDAHGDLQTPETTSSGYLGGMPLRLLTGHRPELIATALDLIPVAPDRVVLVDGRDLDPPEVDHLRGSAIRRCGVTDLADTVAHLPDQPIYLHLDADIVDPVDLPGLRFPAPGGPHLTEVADAVTTLLDTGRVAAVGIACTWEPGHGAAARFGPLVRELLRRLA
ncbi:MULTISPECIES: arginase family protein [unclassified Solwaraspora]|uniref:arginase family protein n=1 Tax=unclassified Solwaraspora TaxID=2627926 RepID=UPI00259B6E20|nr:arginase family protein [Solwaraspora sp. WMMA2056]WJK43154.1 arginase family protein [Solwaraspora sp. WMMA2056]